MKFERITATNYNVSLIYSDLSDIEELSLDPDTEDIAVLLEVIVQEYENTGKVKLSSFEISESDSV